MSCSHTQKIGDLISQDELAGELNALEEIDLSDKKKFSNSLQVIKRELRSVKRGTAIPYPIWDKIGQLLEIYKSLTQFVPQNKILIPAKIKLVLKTDSFCIDPGLPAPDFKEVFQWGYGDPNIPFYPKILNYYVRENQKKKDLIQELIWNLANKTYYENYPDELKEILKEIDPNAFLKLPSRTKSEVIDAGVSILEEASETDIRSIIQIVEGKYYSLGEFRTALEGLKSSYALPKRQFYSRIPETSLFSTTQSQSYHQQTLNFYNPGNETQTLDLSQYYLEPLRSDVQRIAITASLENVDFLKKVLDQFFKDILVQLGIQYPSLTDEEKELIRDYPYESLRVFWHKSRAEFAEWRLFEGGSEDGEADAFRHFVWAGFLTADLGKDLAKHFLDARESEKNPDASDRRMDEYNNKKGIEAALRLEKENRFSAKHLYDLALEALRIKQLVVLRPRGKIPDDATY